MQRPLHSTGVFFLITRCFPFLVEMKKQQRLHFCPARSKNFCIQYVLAKVTMNDSTTFKDIV